jgi:choline dehydrogenase-like flavoprotein
MSSDFLIIGAGSAGATLAGRLTEDPEVGVTLVEGGRNYRSSETPEQLVTNVMGPSMNTQELPDFYWLNYMAQRTSEQPTQDLYWRGKGVGGSSAINGVVAFRATPEDFDDWTALGIEGWTFADVLPYMTRMEDDVMFGDEPYHGRGGPIPVHRFPQEQWSTLDLASVEAGAALGFGFDHPDINAPVGDGFAYLPNNSRDDRRVSCNDAYLEPARERSNLTIRSGVVADQVLFSGSRAVGARVIGPDGSEDLFADEIILCSGTAGSAGIALRSGIGPAADLTSLGIDVIADLPVGQHLQDHVAIGFLFPMGSEGPQGVKRPTVALRHTSGQAGGRNDMMWNVSGPWSHPDLGNHIGTLLTQIYQPFSRGKLGITSRDPMVEPWTSVNLMSDARDRARGLDGVKFTAEFAQQTALAECFVKPPANTLTQVLLADAARFDQREFDAWVLSAVRDLAHLCASCPMGPEGGEFAVVDADCRPFGTEGLRIVDASILPNVTRANTNLPVIMMAEKMSDRLLGKAPLAPMSDPR